jgi:thiol-disulfide isomerase/thioredoxin
MIIFKGVKTEGDINSKLGLSKRTFIKFGATWCGPCETLESLLPMSKANATVIYLDVDTDIGQELSVIAGVRGVPTMVEIDSNCDFTDKSIVGAPTLDNLTKFLGG